MPYPRKASRNAQIVRERDVFGWSFSRIGEHHKIKKWTAWEVYTRTKQKLEEQEAERFRKAIHRQAA